MAPGESNGHVTRNVTWPRQVEVVTPICWGPLPKIWLEIRVELWLHVTLNFYTYRSSIYIRIEISYECYRWQWTDSVFFRTLSCFSKHIPDNAGSACTQPLFTRRKRCPNGKLLELISVEFLQTKVICITQTYELEYWRLWTFIYARTYKKICADMQTTQE